MANHKRLAGRSQTESPLATYLREIDQTKLLTPDEEIEVAQRVRQGDADARAHLIKANLRLVVNIARNYRGKGLGIDDLAGEGNLGLIHATEHYDLAVGTKFSTYATACIHSFIKNALNRDCRRYTLSRAEAKLLDKVHDADSELSKTLAYPTYQEIGKHLGLSESEIKSIPKLIERKEMRANIYQLDSHEDNSLVDSIAAPGRPPEASVEDSDEAAAFFARLEELSAQERAIICWRYELDGKPSWPSCSAKEFAKRHKLSLSGLLIIEKRALRKLKKGGNSKHTAITV